MKRKIFFFLTMFISLTSTAQFNKDVVIEFKNDSINHPSVDTIDIYFEDYFNKDIISLSCNENEIYSDTISTDASTNVAGYVSFRLASSNCLMKLFINDKDYFFNLNKNYRFVLIQSKSKSLIITFTNAAPIYD